MSFTLTILGSNSALPTSERFSTAQVLQLPGRSFLLDCGEGAQIQLRKYKISFESIRAIFISHLHGDHYLGIFGLLSSFNLLGRRKALQIYGPKNIDKIIGSYLQYQEFPLSFSLDFKIISTDKSETVYDDKLMKVDAFPLKHRIETYGYIFREKQRDRNIKKEAIEKYNIPIKQIPRIKKGEDFFLDNGDIVKNEEVTLDPPKPLSYAFCTDTAYNEEILPYIENVDLLYHEATFAHEMADRAKRTNHSTAIQAAAIAHKANARKLIIGHFSARIRDLKAHLNEARTVFGNTELATDGAVFVIHES